MGWLFADEFRDAESERVRRLSAWSSYAQIVGAVVESSTVCRSAKLTKWQHRNDHTSIERVLFRVAADRDAVDALFNSAHGYRAKFLASVSTGDAANEQLVGALWARHHIEVLSVLGRDEPRARVSMAAPQAKAWMKQDERVWLALRGERRASIEVGVEEWARHIDELMPTSHGSRYLARGGVLATSSEGIVDVKGAWLRHDVPWQDPDKACRSYQIALYGFS
jgi:hypothetical protein